MQKVEMLQLCLLSHIYPQIVQSQVNRDKKLGDLVTSMQITYSLVEPLENMRDMFLDMETPLTKVLEDIINQTVASAEFIKVYVSRKFSSKPTT